jgi:hypothetical protein
MINEAKLIQIGNSKGIRLPKPMISKYKLEGVCVLEEIEGGILIHAPSYYANVWRMITPAGRDIYPVHNVWIGAVSFIAQYV